VGEPSFQQFTGFNNGGSRGRGGSGFSHFGFRDAEDIFKQAFGGKDPFAAFFEDDDDFFNSGFGGMGMMGSTGNRQQRQQ